MPTLNALRKIINGKDEGAALDASRGLLRFYTIFNTEYHLLEDKQEEAQLSLFKVENNPKGVNQAKRGALSAFLVEVKGRLLLLDAKLRAFEADELDITPPTKAMVAKVKKESGLLAAKNATDAALKGIIAALMDIAAIADGP